MEEIQEAVVVNDNMSIYNEVRVCPENAQKKIGAGRLKGMTDINPMFRIKMLTQVFGPVGFGWYYEVTKKWLETVGNETRAFVDINLYVKKDGEWSKPIFGTGGSSFATVEKNGLYVNDECYKMALTDAISVATKALGMAADIYWSTDALNTKYAQNEYVRTTTDNNSDAMLAYALGEIEQAMNIETLSDIYNRNQVLHTNGQFMSALGARKRLIIGHA